jgi:predicted lipoprotein with Yx(FWY)xxD motif
MRAHVAAREFGSTRKPIVARVRTVCKPQSEEVLVMRPLYAVVAGVLGLSLVAAGCGGAIPSSNGGPAMLKMTSGKLGSYLVDGKGHTLYLFEKDGRNDSYCAGACAAVWPPLETSSMPHAAGGVDASALGTFKRDDGETQVAYHGHPLYYYAADASTPGKTKGEEVNQFGAQWYLINAAGKSVEPETGSKPGSPKPSYSRSSESKPSTNSGSSGNPGTSGGGSWG